MKLRTGETGYPRTGVPAKEMITRHDFTLPGLDLSRELSREDIIRLEEEPNYDDKSRFLEHCFYLHLLFPNKRLPYRTEPGNVNSDTAIQAMYHAVYRPEDTELAKRRVINPTEILESSDEAMNNIRRMEAVLAVKYLFPDLAIEAKALFEKYWRKAEIAFLAQQAHFDKNYTLWLIANMRLAFPERFKDLEMPAHLLETTKTKMLLKKGHESTCTPRNIAALYILLADEVIVEPGERIEIVPRRPKAATTSPLPERLKL